MNKSARYNDPAPTWSSPSASREAPTVVDDWCTANIRNKPQGNSMAVEIILLISSSCVAGLIFYVPNDKEILSPALYFGLFAVAALIYPYVRSTLPRKGYRQMEILFFYVASACFLIWPDDPYAIGAGRALVGFGTGLIYVEFMYKTAEVCIPRFRGMIGGSTGIVYMGCFMHGTAVAMSDSGTQLYRYIGGFVLMYALMAQIFIFVYAIESPVYYLQRNDVQNATRAMMRLRTEDHMTWEIQRDIKDFQEMLQEDSELDWNIFTQKNMKPLLAILGTRIISVLMVNVPFAFLRASLVDLILFNNDPSVEKIMYFGAFTLTTVRMLGPFFFLFTVDVIGRKKILISSTISSSFIAILLGTLMNFDINDTFYVILCLLYEFLSSFGFPGVCDVFTLEAFPTTKKAGSIGFVLAVEQVLQAVLLIVFQAMRKDKIYHVNDYWLIPIISGVLCLVIGIASWMKLWETKQTTYREARSRLRS